MTGQGSRVTLQDVANRAGVSITTASRVVNDAQRGVGAHLAQPAAGHVERDAAEPGAEPVRGPQALQVGQDRDRGFLGGITRQLGGTENPRRQEHRRVPMTAQQFRERLPVARERLAYQVRV